MQRCNFFCCIWLLIFSPKGCENRILSPTDLDYLSPSLSSFLTLTLSTISSKHAPIRKGENKSQISLHIFFSFSLDYYYYILAASSFLSDKTYGRHTEKDKTNPRQGKERHSDRQTDRRTDIFLSLSLIACTKGQRNKKTQKKERQTN